MAGLRDIIIHQYSRVDTSVLFDIVTAQIPPVLAELAQAIAILRQEAGEEPSRRGDLSPDHHGPGNRSMPSQSRTALVSGGNRGIGLEVCRQLAALGHRVLLGAREPAKG